MQEDFKIDNNGYSINVRKNINGSLLLTTMVGTQRVKSQYFFTELKDCLNDFNEAIEYELSLANK